MFFNKCHKTLENLLSKSNYYSCKFREYDTSLYMIRTALTTKILS